MRRALLTLLEDLERILEVHEELQDSTVRECLREVVQRGFADPQPDYTLPRSFEMRTASGNNQVRAALLRFLADRTVDTVIRAPLTPRERMQWFQDARVRTAKGSLYESFFGHVEQTVTGSWRRQSETLPAMSGTA